MAVVMHISQIKMCPVFSGMKQNQLNPVQTNTLWGFGSITVYSKSVRAISVWQSTGSSYPENIQNFHFDEIALIWSVVCPEMLPGGCWGAGVWWGYVH